MENEILRAGSEENTNGSKNNDNPKMEAPTLTNRSGKVKSSNRKKIIMLFNPKAGLRQSSL